MTRVRRQGSASACDVVEGGVAIAAFGFATGVPLALLMLAFAGDAGFVSAVLRSTILLQVTPDSMRGRLAGDRARAGRGTPALGNLEAGALASLVGIRASVVSGGVLCVVGTAVVALALPAFRTLREARVIGRDFFARSVRGRPGPDRGRLSPLEVAWAA